MKRRTARLALALVLVSLALILAGTGSANAVGGCSPDAVNQLNGGWPVCVYVLDNFGNGDQSWTGVRLAQMGEVFVRCDRLGSRGDYKLVYGIGVFAGGTMELTTLPAVAGFACFSA